VCGWTRGIDPVTGKQYRLVEHVPADTPNKEAVAGQIRIRLVNQVDERRHFRTNATPEPASGLLSEFVRRCFCTVNNYRGL
jgi:hypothetical protein